MADTFQLTDGTTTVDLIYNSSTQRNYKLRRDGAQLGSTEPRAIWHRPSDYPAELIDAVDDTQIASLTVMVHQDSDIDDMLDAIVKARRLLRQAKRYYELGDVDRVTLKVQLDGATNATLWPVLYGWVDDSRAQYESVARKHGIAYDAQVVLHLAPYGEAETAITLRNVLHSSPHFVSDLNSDGLADGWALIGTPTTSIRTNRYLIGGSSQRIITDNSTSHGIRSDTIPVAISSTITAYAWVYHSGFGVDPITVQLNDGSGNLIAAKVLQAGDAGGVSDRIAPDAVDGSQLWYRVALTGSNSSAADAQLLIYRASGSATQNSQFWIDACYMEVGGGAPDAWASAYAIDNRNDPNSSNEDRINYIDTWGVPGDAPALVTHKLDWTAITSSKSVFYAGKATDGKILAAERVSWVDSDQFSTSFATNAAWSTGTGTSKNHYHRLTQDGSISEGSGELSLPSVSGDTVREMFANPIRAFGICRSSSVAATFKLSYGLNPATADSSEEITVGATVNNWALLDFGMINMSGQLPFDVPDTSEPDLNLLLTIEGLPGSGSDTADFDALLLMSTDEFLIVESSNFTTSNEFYVRGHYQDTILSELGYRDKERLGTMWTLEPGRTMNRITFAITGPTGIYTLTDAALVTLEITPRTRHLLGAL